ncbi:aminoglycoside phosphotransferase family protein [Kitasatospora sp. NPDC001603]|uniref:aminoglycoside phosphotransferase family protein n=1 Tax=Kitasatospora sp. NPDC001603 TaxID=3154388 RepID=UPI00332D3446
MDPALITGLLSEITSSTNGPAPARLPLRVWSMSGVERLTHADGSTAILKYAREPFTREDRILRSAAQAGVPVPRVLGSAQGGGLLVMVLEDLGDPLREADDSEAATAAAVLHAANPPTCLPTLDQSALAALPGNALDHLQRLQAADRWTEGTDDLTSYLHALERAADKRAAGAHTAPFGWVHSEYHSSSLHIGPLGPRLLDFAHSFAGPGLLDIAAWQGLAKAQPPDPARLHALIGAYIAAGGHPDALARRGGLPPERWALGWHRVWAVEWFLTQARTWINDPAKDLGSVKVVRRHLAAAVDLLAA